MEILTSQSKIPGKVIDAREIPSDVTLVIPLVCRLVDRLMEDKFVTAEDRRKVELCLDEAVTNAVIHGNDSNFNKMVQVELFYDDEAWGVLVTDDGDGFTPDVVPDLEVDEQLWQESGRGIALMRLYMDNVVYYNCGRTVLMFRKSSRNGTGDRA